MAESPRQRLPDAHQSHFAGSNGKPAAAPVPFNTSAEEEHPVTQQWVEAGLKVAKWVLIETQNRRKQGQGRYT